MTLAPSQATTTIVDVLRARAAGEPSAPAFRFLPDGTSSDQQEWSYLDLLERATAVAAALRDHGVEGRRVLLARSPGLEYVAALFGIFLAGATAVPCFPPIGRRARARFTAILLDAQADVVVMDERFRSIADALATELASLPARPRWLLLGDDLAAERPDATTGPTPALAELALLQYTSGSTGQPKGVMLTHDNVISNCRVLDANMGYEPDRVGCSWLPPYHDMGLMGTILLAVHGGWPLVMMSPLHFVQSPYRWLQAITEHHVTISVAPNSALDLTAASVTDDELDTLDLSSLRQLYCGSEPVFKATLDRFRERFGPRGYSEAALIPCYGLAEATLFVTGRRRDDGITSLALDRSALERGVVAAAGVEADAREILSCGRAAVGHEVVVVDPESSTPAAPDAVGELWVRGPNVARGYFERERESRETFGATLAGRPDEAPYLRTGDLGFVSGGEVFVTGRSKDLIVISGRNIYPEDVELSVQSAHAFRRVAAFSVVGDATEDLVVVGELSGTSGVTGAMLEEVRDAVIAAVTTDHGVRPSDVRLTPPAAIPVTTSGKVRRGAARQKYVDGELPAVTPDGSVVPV